MRRVITQTGKNGKSEFIQDDSNTREIHIAAYKEHPALNLIWGTSGTKTHPFRPEDITHKMPFIPEAGDICFFVNVCMPDKVMGSLSKKEVEQNFMDFIDQIPEFGKAFDLSRLGMHRTNTIEYGYVISGQVYLEVDNQERKLLQPGDTWVNNSAMHAWRNPFDEPCISIITMQGIRGPKLTMHNMGWGVKHFLWKLINKKR